MSSDNAGSEHQIVNTVNCCWYIWIYSLNTHYWYSIIFVVTMTLISIWDNTICRTEMNSDNARSEHQIVNTVNCCWYIWILIHTIDIQLFLLLPWHWSVFEHNTICSTEMNSDNAGSEHQIVNTVNCCWYIWILIHTIDIQLFLLLPWHWSVFEHNTICSTEMNSDNAGSEHQIVNTVNCCWYIWILIHTIDIQLFLLLPWHWSVFEHNTICSTEMNSDNAGSEHQIVNQGCHSLEPKKFPDFSLTFHWPQNNFHWPCIMRSME